MKRFCRGVTITIASVCVIGFAIITVRAEELKTAAAVMDFSSTKMAAYKTWSADYLQSMNTPGGAITINGQIAQKLPREMWMQLDMPMMGQPGKMTMILGEDGILWQIMDIANRPQIMKADMNRVESNMVSGTGAKFNPLSQMDPRKQWETSKKMYDFKVVAAKDADGPRVYVLEGLSKTGGATNQPVAAKAGKMRVTIGQDDGFIHRMEIYDKSLTNLVTSMEFKNLKFNADIPDSKFIYQPPADAHVSDVTAMFEMRMHARDADGEPATSESAPSRSAPAAPQTP